MRQRRWHLRTCLETDWRTQANILSLEEQIIDATTEEGQKQLKEMEAAVAAESKNELAEDPE